MAATEHLATYLNDHLAGAVGALELIEHVERAHAEDQVGAVMRQLKADVEEDRRDLEAILERLGVSDSGSRKAVAWLGERVARLKLRIDDPSDGALRLFEAIEAISLGIEGKHSLWSALAATASAIPELQTVDYDRLVMRAHQQRAALEPARLDSARAALGGDDER